MSHSLLLDLGLQPLANNLAETRTGSLESKRYPLRAIRSKEGFITLDTEVNPRLLYDRYLYRSGASLPFIDHCRSLYRTLNHLDTRIVIDIGGNDGTLLRSFREEDAQGERPWSGTGIERLINVDASRELEPENASTGIEFHGAYFGPDLDLPKAGVITSLNVFQHTKNLEPFLDGIVKFLDGVWVLEFPYAIRTLETMQFDQFYHEHYHYWMVGPLRRMLSERGMRIVHALEVPIHGGSMRLWIAKEEKGAPSTSLDRFIRAEEAFDYDGFHSSVHSFIDEARSRILSLKGRTAFFGAAAKGCVFLNALGISVREMPDAYVVDDTKVKQGKFIPGTGFEVVPRSRMVDDDIDNVVVLAHNFRDHIESSLRRSGYSGPILSFLPR